MTGCWGTPPEVLLDVVVEEAGRTRGGPLRDAQRRFTGSYAWTTLERPLA